MFRFVIKSTINFLFCYSRFLKKVFYGIIHRSNRLVMRYFEGLEKKIKILSRGDGEMEFRDIYTPSLYFHYVSKSDQIFKSRILKYFRDEIFVPEINDCPLGGD